MPTMPTSSVTQAVTELAETGYTRLQGLFDQVQVGELRQLLASHADRLQGSLYPGFTEARPDDGAVFMRR